MNVMCYLRGSDTAMRQSNIIHFALVLLVFANHFASGKPMDEMRISLSHNLGKVKENSTYKHTFNIKNTFGQPFKLSRIKKQCSCTSVSVSKSEILPGEFCEATVEVEITGRSHNSWETTVSILDDSDKPRIVELQLVGEFPEDSSLFAVPKKINLGRIPKTATVT